MTILALYPTKKALKESIGQNLRFVETSAFGNEYISDGSFAVAGRPHMASIVKREFFATVTMKDGKISKVT